MSILTTLFSVLLGLKLAGVTNLGYSLIMLPLGLHILLVVAKVMLGIPSLQQPQVIVLSAEDLKQAELSEHDDDDS